MLFSIEQAHWHYEDFLRKKNGLQKYSLERFVELIFHHCPPLQAYASDVASIYKDFKTYKSGVPVCGCILLNSRLTKVVLVLGYGSKSWSFPRGKINKDEQPSACALREVLEETGYDASANLLLDEYIDFTNRKQAIRLYLCPDVAEDTVFETRTRNEIRQIKWFKVSQLPMSYEASKQPGLNLFSVPPVLVSQLRSWIKKRKGGGNGNGAAPPPGSAKKKKGKGKQQRQPQQQQQQQLSDPHFPTDSEISNRQFTERDLIPWEPEDDSLDSSDLQLNKSVEGWNQWQANHEKFGFVSTYDIEDYTTKLDLSKAEYADKLLASFGIRPTKKKQSDGIPVAVTSKKSLKQPQPQQAPAKTILKKKQPATKETTPASSPAKQESSDGFKINKSSVLDAFDM
jgi:8-oxo-dGTP pyrophosphatase MutT (NUDIX family)